MTVKEIVEQRRFVRETGVEVVCGDAAEVLRTLPENHFDACLTDPPYGLEFMGKEWDHGVPRKGVWREVLRVLKPGAMMLAFGGTRTHHRLMCAIEDAGFEIRDCLMWLYGQGFPKGLDIGKALDKRVGAEREVISFKRAGIGRNSRGGSEFVSYTPIEAEKHVPVTAPATDAAKLWDGYNVALKPAWEPVILAMKPCEGTFAENALKWGVAGLNIAGCRIASNVPRPQRIPARGRMTGNSFRGGVDGSLCGSKAVEDTMDGRWPANVVLDGEAAGQLDGQSGMLSSGKMKAATRRNNTGGWAGPMPPVTGAETVGDSGGASRFFYCAKASRDERGPGNSHPTVKPLKLCEYLARLLLPPARPDSCHILVPFCGSGSEIIGALRAGWERVAGIDNNAEYCELARRRIRESIKPDSEPAPASPPPG